MKLVCFLTFVALGLFWMVATLSGQSTQPAQPAQDQTGPKTAEQVYKNIQVLKGIPADQLTPTMTFISASLGVECEFCHVGEQREKDDKKTKQTARQMIQMQMAINKENFEGRTRVTCNSCHQGRHEPIAIPVVAEEEPKAEKPESGPPKPGELPTADELINKYIQALGGGDALVKITSRVEKGTISIANGPQFPIDLFAKAPNMRVSFMHTPRGDSITAFDGKTAWLGSPAGTNKLDPASSEAVKLDAEFNFALHIKQIFSQLRVSRPEKVKDRDANVIFALQQGQPPVRLYFDKESGLLVRLVRYADTPLGRLPTQIDYGDYRDSGGVKIPYRWTIARPPRGRFTIQVDQVQQNVPIEDSTFAMPAGK